ncbi:MAG: hypothetical protein RDV48_22810 [Candidatus Eremiobacteraeota bacterium]|nr:hypothetical protein [Candidatus Eremiobacteraeota bacterium]
MITYYGSGNSRYFVWQRGNTVALHRDFQPIWKREMPYKRFRVIGVGNNGNVSLVTEEGLYIHVPSSGAPPEFVQRYSKEALKKDGAYLGKIVMHEDGEGFFIESIMAKKSGMEQILGLSSSQGRGAAEEHRINFLDLKTRRHKRFDTTLISRDLEKSFLWDVSGYFTFFVFAEPRKAGGTFSYKIAVVNVQTEEIYLETEVQGTHLSSVRVNDEGTLFLEKIEGEEKKIEILTQDKSRFLLAVPLDYTLLHCGKKFVAFETHPVPSLLVKSFEDNLMCHADLRSLEHLKVHYAILFNDRDHIDFLYLVGDDLKLVKTEVDLFIAEARRWEGIASQKMNEPQEKLKHEQMEQEKTQSRDHYLEGRKSQLSAQLASIKEEKQTKTVTTAAEVNNALEALKFQFVLGNIDADEYAQKREELLKHIEGSSLKPPREASGKDTLEPIPFQRRKEAPQESPASERRKEAPRESLVIDGRKEKLPEPASRGKKSLEEKGEPEGERLERLMSALEERFIMGQVSERSYLELKEKYEKRLKELGRL